MDIENVTDHAKKLSKDSDLMKPLGLSRYQFFRTEYKYRYFFFQVVADTDYRYEELYELKTL